MAGRRQRWKRLQLLIILSLFILTNQFEMRDVQEKLSRDVAAELHLRGTSHAETQELLKISESSLINKQLLLHNDKDLDGFLEHLDKQMMEDWWRSVSEMSPSFRHKVLVLTGSTNSPDREMRQENSLDPQKCVPVSMKFLYNQSCMSELDSNTEGEMFSQNQQTGSGFSGSSHEHLTLKLKPGAAAGFSPHGNTTMNSGVHLLKASMVHGPKEPNQENPQIYEAMDKSDLVSSFRTQKRPDDPILEFDHQQILMLEDDEVVRISAASLYEKHPAVSSVHVVGPQLRVQQVKGQPVVLSEHSSLVLVGHGARDHSGEMRISGYTYKDVVRIIQNTSRISEKIQTTTVVACDVGSDQRFREALLKKLHEAGIETELHLWNSVVQVTETGEVISQDVSADGPQWRSGDHTKKVVLTVGRNGEIRRRKESDQRGQEVLTNDTNVLQTSKPTLDPRFQKYRSSWPEQPRRSVPLKVFNNIFDQLKQNFKELEGLSWGLFHSDQPKPDKVNVLNLNIKNFIIGKRDKNGNINWLNEEKDVKELLKKCYEIKSGKDVRNIIRHFAKDGEDETTYLMVNNWIYEVDPQSLYVYPVGKKRNHDPKTRPSVDQLKQSIEVQMGKADYPHIKAGLRQSAESPSENIELRCAQYFSGIFSFTKPVYIQPVAAEAWCTTYFVASVISESARNFRTFPLILMALDMTEEKKNMKDGVTFLFDEHSMTRGGSWVDPSRRGFTGSATPEGSSKLENKGQNKKTEELLLDDLKNVIYREDVMFTKWKRTIGGDQSFKTYVDQMAKIAERYKVLIDPSIKLTFKKDCKNFKNAADREENTETIKIPGSQNG